MKKQNSSTLDPTKKQGRAYMVWQSNVDPSLWQRLELVIEFDEDREPKLINYKWCDHDAKNMVIESIGNQIAMDVVSGLYR